MPMSVIRIFRYERRYRRSKSVDDPGVYSGSVGSASSGCALIACFPRFDARAPLST